MSRRLATFRSRRRRVRSSLLAKSAGRPRLSVHRSQQHIYAQVIDDSAGRTLVSASSLEKDAEGGGTTVAAADAVGRRLAERAKAAGIAKVVFDRGGFLYHGRVKALADAARAGGLEF